MEFRFGYTGLTAGEAALVKVRLADSASGRADASLRGARRRRRSRRRLSCCPPSVRSRGESGRAPPGPTSCACTSGSTVLTKTVVVSDAVTRRSPVRPARGFVNQLLYPSETPLPERFGPDRHHDCLSGAPVLRGRLGHRLVRRVPRAHAGVCARAEGGVRRRDVRARPRDSAWLRPAGRECRAREGPDAANPCGDDPRMFAALRYQALAAALATAALVLVSGADPRVGSKRSICLASGAAGRG